MEVLERIQTDWTTTLHEIGPNFASRAAQSDRDGTFVFENYEELKAHRFFSAMVPEELGGGGMSYPEMCNLIRTMAHYCSSTALAFSMHQHLVAATIWKYKHKDQGAPVLQKVADQQLVLISTGARDWLASNGELEKVEGGYLFSAKKAFASQSIAGDVAVTSAPFLDEDGQWQVKHFSVPMKSEGVEVLDDWKVMGMRATGSQTIQFNRVFVPESAIALTRPQGDYHSVWDLVIMVAMPLIMSAYVGIAEKAMDIALEIGKKYHRNQDHLSYITGRLYNQLLSAQSQWRSMYALTDNFEVPPSEDITIKILSYKTNVADAAMETVASAMEAIGGQSFYQKNQMERLFRDVQASQFHPLPRWEQIAFTGERLLQDNG
ncbi:MAG: acyl-CoA dehydrogenase family protein [Saprospiraceae bacterium]|nr:acyl-CoA dehydrogenase family protein [Lewinella sp.]